jgi:mono/diheme cytochrome c family protein
MHSSQQPAASSQQLNTHIYRLMIQRLVIVTLAALCVACTTLGGEPRVVSTIPPATETPTPAPDRGEPSTAPDLANGARIYADNCAACHGETGQGDGPVALDTEGMEPRDFTDPASAREQTPHEWFRTITNGNIEKLMPPWRNVLTEQERWDVALYTYTMHYDTETLAIGERIYQDCAECHGPEGRGDGPEAADLAHEVKDLTDQGAMITLSDGSIFNMVTQGFEDVMPSYHELLEEDRWAVVEYARTLSLGNVPWQTGLDAPPAAAGTTDSMTAITGTALLVQIYAAGDGLDVVQALRVRNLSERLAFSQNIALPDGQTAALGLTMPDGAMLTASSGIGGISEDGRTAYAIEPLPPISEQLYVLNYTLPYTVGDEVSIPLDVVIGGPVRVLVRPLEMRVRGELLPGFGEQTLGSELYNAYGDQLALQAGTVLTFTLEGTPDEAAIVSITPTPAFTPPANVDRGVSPDVVVPLVILVVLLASGAVIYAIWRRTQTPEARIMQIAREIGRIDAAHKAGTLNHDLWHRQRAALKEEQLTLRGYPPEETKKDDQ